MVPLSPNRHLTQPIHNEAHGNGVEDEYGEPPGRKTRRDNLLKRFTTSRSDLLARLAQDTPDTGDPDPNEEDGPP